MSRRRIRLGENRIKVRIWVYSIVTVNMIGKRYRRRNVAIGQRLAKGSGGLAILILGLLLSAWHAASAQVRTRGADIADSRISVNSAAHWEHWALPTHAVDLVDDSVVPHYFRDRFNVLVDHETYRRPISQLVFRDKSKEHGAAALTAIPTVRRVLTYDDKGELRLRGDLKMGKYLDTNYLRYPGNETHVVLDGQLYAIADTTMTSEKEGVLTLRNARTGQTSRRDFQTKDKNPVPIYQYFSRQGVSRAGSDPPAAGALFDGSSDTYWEPAAEDPIASWWIEVDLGRTVVADQIVVRFVDDGMGDPFRQFKVLTSPGQELISQSTEGLELSPVGGTRSPNEKQRLFTIDLEPPLDVTPEWTGRPVRTIRIAVFDTRGGRHTLLSPDDQETAEMEWQALDAADRGDIVHFVRGREGFEQPVTAEEYEGLPPERQGRRDYYRRERPRLADIEVWGLGDNIGPGIIAGGGRIDVVASGIAAASQALDGDFNTLFLHVIGVPNFPDRGKMTVDLGATFWLDQVRILSTFNPSQIAANNFDGYLHRFSDGTRDPTGQLKYERLSPFERENNMAPQYFSFMDTYASTPKVRYLEARILSERKEAAQGGAFIRDYQLYTRAYPAEILLESDIFAIPSAQNFGRIFWEAETPPGTRVEVRTRSGDLIGRIVNYYHRSGEFNGNDEAKWERLGPNKGATDTVYVPTQSAWSLWSNPYPAPGARVTSPGLRRFMQVQVKMITEDRETAPTLRSLDIELVSPAAERILAELRPDRVAAPGVVDTFEVFILPNFVEGPASSRSSGFDEILLEMSGGAMEFVDVALDVDPETGVAMRVFGAGAGGFVDGDGAALEVMRARGDSIWLRLPDVQNILPAAPREYRRVTRGGDQVPIDAHGFPLTGAAWALLDEAEQGDVRYFSQRDEGDEVVLTPVADEAAFEALDPGEQGPVRYFRILLGDGALLPYGADGELLTASSYQDLAASEQGAVVGAGQLLRLRYTAPVFRNGTTVKLAVRNSDGGGDADAPWHGVEAGDATPMVESNTLSIALPLESNVLDRVELRPNPFSPNGDGVNDAVEIGFSVFKISAVREIAVGIHALDGRRVWKSTRMIRSGEESVRWTGVDEAGNRVPPGLYLCKVALDADSREQGGTTVARVIAVAY